MVDRLQSIRGMVDILPDELPNWRRLESLLVAVALQYGYDEIRFPILESTALFKRGVGDVTDIVEKEMYSFTDLNGDSLSLRPEGTAPCVRAGLQHGLLHNQQQKLFYLGPMFRHEKPQKGRNRQFHQFGFEVFGLSGIAIELELILIGQFIWKNLGLDACIDLEINTIGDQDDRSSYREKLFEYFSDHRDQLDTDSQSRLTRSPLRILDSKNPQMKNIIAGAPSFKSHMKDASWDRFASLCELLSSFGISYRLNPYLVRGMDYYSHTVFEWVTQELGSQGTVCAGGRYDGLVAQLGGKPQAAVGCAFGLERLIILMNDLNKNIPENNQLIYLLAETEPSIHHALKIAENLRASFPKARVWVNTQESNLKNQLKRADKSGADLALIIEEKYEGDGLLIGIKYLRHSVQQKMVMESELIPAIAAFFRDFN